MTKQEKEDIKTILNYLWRDEERHYLEWGGYPKDHIYRVLKRLAKRVEYKGSDKPYFSWKLV